MAFLISIHALLAESDRIPQNQLSANGISIHALLAESDIIPIGVCVTAPISIHALLAESDLAMPDLGKGYIWISIHALLAESDAFRSPRIALMVDFYPRSPCGERPNGGD